MNWTEKAEIIGKTQVYTCGQIQDGKWYALIIGEDVIRRLSGKSMMNRDQKLITAWIGSQILYEIELEPKEVIIN